MTGEREREGPTHGFFDLSSNIQLSHSRYSREGVQGPCTEKLSCELCSVVGEGAMERPAMNQNASQTSTLAASATVVAPPTTFVQADANNFRDVVQKLTGAAAGDSADKLPVTAPARPVVGPRRQPFKLHDRRPSVRKLEIKLGFTSIHSPRSPQPQVLPSSPSSPQFQGYQLVAGGMASATKTAPFPSPVTPLVAETVFSEEERAIAEKGFYLHPSPRTTTPRGSDPPELLTLFPLTSPRQAKSSDEVVESGGKTK